MYACPSIAKLEGWELGVRTRRGETEGAQTPEQTCSTSAGRPERPTPCSLLDVRTRYSAAKRCTLPLHNPGRMRRPTLPCSLMVSPTRRLMSEAPQAPMVYARPSGQSGRCPSPPVGLHRLNPSVRSACHSLKEVMPDKQRRWNRLLALQTRPWQVNVNVSAVD